MSATSTGNEAAWPNYALPRGTTIHGYTIERVLGSGGFGITYLARDLVEQPFAIKEYFPRDFATRQALNVLASSDEDTRDFNDCLDRFRREAQALVLLSRAPGLNEGIVRIVTYFEAHGTGFLVMAYAEGDTLARVLRQEPGGLAPERVRSLLDQLLLAVGMVHRAGLMHRDIKPGNIILGDDGKVTLIDFGSSREETGGRTKTHTTIFSAGYAPLEQMLGLAQGPFSDIYAIGAVGYHAIGGGMVDALTRNNKLSIGDLDPMPPAEHIGAGRYPMPLLRAIDAALAINPGERPPTLEAMRLIMEPAMAGGEREMFDPASSSGGPTVLVRDFILNKGAQERGGPRTEEGMDALRLGAAGLGEEAPATGRWLTGPRAAAIGLAAMVAAGIVAYEPILGFFTNDPGPSMRASGLAAASAGPVLPALAFDGGKRDCERCPRMVLIPKGTFLMGVPEGEARREGAAAWDKNAKPHEVTFRRPFHMSETPVSRGEYNECVRAMRCKGDFLPRGQPADHPVTQISHEDALAYIAWLNKTLDRSLGRGAYALPSEAQWEYAARAGTAEARYWGDDFVDGRGDTVPRAAGGTMVLKSFRPNAFGLYDMLGHVWQWTEDQWHDDYTAAPDDGTPWGSAWTGGEPSGGTEDARWVMRGGSWSGELKTIRAGYRDWSDRSGLRYALTGFRVVRAY